MKKIRLGLAACVASILCLGTSAGFAGEVDGKGRPVPGGENGRSECSFSGQQDDDSNEGVFKSARTQSWGQLFNEIRLALIAAGFTPGKGIDACNPNRRSQE